ncbi:Putative glutamine synthetase, catalytic domain, metal-dependent hydrolase [Septoria linicola]|uniref:Glutamine synthetase, catalytic domain, metal-dependent hydrolase n=1 Tax=Septoria linicola TaxID=215465 RepID=A0A9Q9ER20_9PEZI|nr:putative glutamine synthetase, catalytic domain, metal-dependent hydrolase [Septoria linicola]USW59432.1 Putative glutamine synthetase, catalytic domain, metal-dependent hydrolase [Septoria linicola]
MAADNATIEDVRRVIRTTPIIDNHAHNLLQLEQLKQEDFLSGTSEATGKALRDHATALPHFRATRQLRDLYGLPKDADWEAISARRQGLLDQNAIDLIRKCLAGTHTILIDDGFVGTFHPYNWHDQFVTAPCKRIVRIEAVASEILHGMHKAGKLPIDIALADEEACSLAWIAFITAFEEAMVAYLEDDEVVGFKSVICYRTGLDIETGSDIEVSETALRSFTRHFLPQCAEKQFRVQTKGMNDALVISIGKLIQAAHQQNGAAKPLQFHTGLGDNDISLLDSNPAVMQEFLRIFPEVPIVLLHSSYPYTREAGYLATVYENVYLDLGEVFPQVSRDGQEQIIRQALELTPTSKLLWSTDGHHFPETYYLANTQGRCALNRVFCEYVDRGDLSATEAIHAVQHILFENSNRLYRLGLQLPGTSELGSGEEVIPASDLVSPQQRFGSAIASIVPQWQTLVRKNSTRYILVQWLDYMAQMRSRWFPVGAFQKLMNDRAGHIAISKGNLGTTPNDHMSSVCHPVGSIYVEPDLESIRLMTSSGSVKDAATIMARFTNIAGEPLPICPRARLQSLVQKYQDTNAIDFLVGFEIEVSLCRTDMSADGLRSFSPLDTNHAWGTLSDEQYVDSLELITSIVEALARIGVEVEQFHSEAGAGQYEFVLPPLPPVQAVDVLIQARQCIQQVGAIRDRRATYHPLPFPGIGTAAHAHISLNSDIISSTSKLKVASESFAAGVLEQLPAICAITMPQPISYGRVADDSWTGGTWVAWGTNNRETPLRRVNDTRWEVRCLDGLANMYLALAGVLAAGLMGVANRLPLEMQDCQVNPTKLSQMEKEALGVTRRLPRSLEEALATFEQAEEYHACLDRCRHATSSHIAGAHILVSPKSNGLSQLCR